jgi:hypothetical protein
MDPDEVSMLTVVATVARRTNGWWAAHRFIPGDGSVASAWTCAHEHPTEQAAMNCSKDYLSAMIDRHGRICVLCGKRVTETRVAIFDAHEYGKGEGGSVAHMACAEAIEEVRQRLCRRGCEHIAHPPGGCSGTLRGPCLCEGSSEKMSVAHYTRPS